jgi:poly(A) polymerase
MTGFNGKLLHQDWMVAPETVKLMAALNDGGAESRFVGGCVRNALANRRVIDIDIATPLKPDDVIEKLKAHKINYAPTGLKHGTVTAIVDGKPFEITTLRVDVKPLGRHADVKFTDDWKADAARRDFTINAMSATTAGEIFDPFGGIRDLAEGRVVFVGDPEKRIGEDILRILRFFRFVAHFGRGAPDAAGLKACGKLAHLLPRLSAERVRQETLKILDSDRAAEIWRVMLEAGVSGNYLPEATNVAALDRLTKLETAWHGGAHPLRRLAALLVVNAEGLEQVIEALRLSNEQAAQMRKMSFPPPLPHDEAGTRRFTYTQGGDTARNVLLLAAANVKTDAETAALKKLYDVATAFRPPRFPLKGEDVMKLGVPAGPRVGKVLKEMEDWWLAQDFKPGRTECLDRLGKLHARA